VATAPIAEELSALEQARSRLEAALAGDENWRALAQPGRADDSAEARAARQARNTRLEMALADNAHYQAWKHVNGAIAALRARTVAQAKPAEPVVRPAAIDKATRGSDDLPDDVAALLRDAAFEDARHDEQGGDVDAEPVAAAVPSPSVRDGLVERLERLEEDPPAAAAGSAVRPGVDASSSAASGPRKQDRKADLTLADPPEATVTFVVREQRVPVLPSGDLPPDLGTQRNSALFDRLRSLDEPAAPAGEAFYPSRDSGEEAEVTIISAEGVKQRRETEERDHIVRRFRKALSGD
jgi:hypothetical protein